MAISIIKCTKSHRKMREQKETLSPDGTVLNQKVTFYKWAW